jgi:hypothetical protein
MSILPFPLFISLFIFLFYFPSNYFLLFFFFLSLIFLFSSLLIQSSSIHIHSLPFPAHPNGPHLSATEEAWEELAGGGLRGARLRPRPPVPTLHRPPPVSPTAAVPSLSTASIVPGPHPLVCRRWISRAALPPVDLEAALSGCHRGWARRSERRRPPPPPALRCPALQLADGRLQVVCLHCALAPVGPRGQRLESARQSCRGSGLSCVYAASPRWNRARE